LDRLLAPNVAGSWLDFDALEADLVEMRDAEAEIGGGVDVFRGAAGVSECANFVGLARLVHGFGANCVESNGVR